MSPRTSLIGLCASTTALAVLLMPADAPASAPGTAAAPARASGASDPSLSATASSAVVAPVAAARVGRRAVQTQWSARVVERGQRLTVNGQVPRRHQAAVLQLRRGSRWVALASTVTRNGRVRLVVPTGRVGHFTYRLVALVDRRQRRDGQRRSLSPAVRITVVHPEIARATKQGFALGDPSDFTYISRTPARWNPCSTITYRVNADQGPATALADVQGAVARIEEATGLDLEYVGVTDLVPRDNSANGYPRDTQLVIAWASRSQSPMISADHVAGVGGPRGWYGNVDQDGSPILTWSQGTVVINTAFNRLDPGFGTGATMGKLLMHEISHVVGLGHAATEPQVMYPTLQREYPSAWGAGDRAGLATLGAEEGCIVTPGGAPVAGGRRGAVSVVAPVVQN